MIGRKIKRGNRVLSSIHIIESHISTSNSCTRAFSKPKPALLTILPKLDSRPCVPEAYKTNQTHISSSRLNEPVPLCPQIIVKARREAAHISNFPSPEATASATHASTSSGFRTSVRKKIARPRPRRWHIASCVVIDSAFGIDSDSKSAQTTRRAPSLAMASAMARPRLEDAPVTMATLLERRCPVIVVVGEGEVEGDVVE